MRGAIIGDIVGSVYEWHNIKTKDFPFFCKAHRCSFTDDSVLTCAVAHAAYTADKNRLPDGEIDYKKFGKDLNKAYHVLTMEYPGRGYGGHFAMWAMDLCAEPYNSCGNGSAMRVSPVAWVARSEQECIKMAEATALPTHNHPDGIAGAVCTARATWYARHGKTNEEIRKMVEEYYPLDFTLDQIRPDYKWGGVCSNTVPQAMEAFLEADSYEDAIRNVISIGGDSDTLAAITGAVAEGRWGVPEDIWAEGLKYFNDDFLRKVEKAFHTRFVEGK